MKLSLFKDLLIVLVETSKLTNDFTLAADTIWFSFMNFLGVVLILRLSDTDNDDFGPLFNFLFP